MKKVILAVAALTFAFASSVYAEALKFTGVVEQISGEKITIKQNDGGKSVTLIVKDPTTAAKITAKKIDVGDTVHVKYESTTNVISRLSKPGC